MMCVAWCFVCCSLYVVCWLLRIVGCDGLIVVCLLLVCCLFVVCLLIA